MAGEEIFQEQDGGQIKFFIQKNIGVENLSTLRTQITANGGRVEAKVPIQGYVLIEPGSAEGERLIDCWESPDRPLRNFVPYTFVAACLDAGKLIPQVFRKNGVALKFHIHPSITNENVIETLQKRISHSGGNPLATEIEADIIIADESTPIFPALIERFDHYHDTFVEGIPWVKECVESGVYKNTPLMKKNLGGRIAGTKRTEFTSQDDKHLAGYIAGRLPDPSMRGRTGNKLYQDLCARIDLYPWATRHSWQSWRERYKNNPARFRALIATYLEHHPVPESGKGLHGFVRATSSPLKSQSKQPGAVSKKRVKHVQDLGKDDKAENEWESQWPIKEGNKSPPLLRGTKRKADSDSTEESNKEKRHKSNDSSEHEQTSQSTRNIVLDLANQECAQKTNPHNNKSESMCKRVNEAADPTNTLPPGDNCRARSQSPVDSYEAVRTLDSSNEDAISEGDDIGQETQALLDASKAMLTRSRHSSRVAMNPSEEDQPREPGSINLPIDPPATLANSERDDVKLALCKIACDFRFLFVEVMEEYEELGRDLDQTRSYFKEIRAYINERKSLRNK